MNVPSNQVLHTSKSIMTEQDNAVIAKRALQTLVEALAAQGIKCHMKVARRDNTLVPQYYARVGDTLVPIGHADTRKFSKISPLAEYSLKCCYMGDDYMEFLYTIMAYCKADAIEAASAFCKNRHVNQATLTDDKDNFIWVF